MKKRYIVLACAIIMILMSCGIAPWLSPVRPFIQLPGELYPGTSFTNTFAASLLAYVILIIIAVTLRARSRTADEVPTGFYNFFEWVLEGAYGFAANIAGEKKVKDFFPFFMTYILFILVANWLGLVPGFDSIGVWEYKPHFLAEGAARDEGLVKGTEEYEEFVHKYEVEVDAENKADLRVGPLLIRNDFARADAEIEVLHAAEEEHNEESAVPAGEKIGWSKEAADWTIVPFFRPAATDLNLTLALAIIAMIMVQYYGFKYLGARGYLAKFFPFIAPGFGAEVAKNPIRAIDPAVGILELVSEISKIISFAFRLLGNIFAGMVLLFVMSFLLPAANIVFFGLEFFVGLIQAIVFALLMLIFMASATESHHGDDHDHH